MKRLAKTMDDVDDAVELMKRIIEAVNSAKDAYYVMFDNLNALYKSYPNIYKEIEMLISMPSNDDANKIAQLQSDMNDISKYFLDGEYIKTFLQKND